MSRSANALFVCPRLLSPNTNGLAIRVFNVARQLRRRGLSCHAVVDARDREGLRDVFCPDSFESVYSIEPGEPRSSLRYFRLSDEHYGRRANPQAFQRAVADLQAISAKVSADVAISASTAVAGIVRNIRGVQKIADICDSPSLALRLHRLVETQRSKREILLARLEHRRLVLLERSICRQFDKIVTISDADTQSLLHAAEKRDRHKLLTVPNGVSASYMSSYAAERTARTVAFWGNLNFPPNETAVLYFFENVFVPFLEKEGIGWSIFGPHATEAILNLSRRHRQINLPGYVSDLASSLADIPILVNPMIIGAGQKNKVLEAFALGVAVVSTRLGMSGIEALPGEHYFEADEPESFAEAIRLLLSDPEKRQEMTTRARQLVARKYSWECAGEHWHRLIIDVTNSSPRAA